MQQIVGTCDIVFITLDTLRFDVATGAMARGQTPFLQRLLPTGWEQRHTPGSFTFAAHQAFFAGFLPTPAGPGPHPRRFAARFPGSETTTEETFVFEEDNIVAGLAAVGYHTICVGGVGFFNKLSALGRVLPDLFQESHWSPRLGVTERRSTEFQIDVAISALQQVPADQRVFLFLNVSALHQPNCLYVDGATSDSTDTQAAALAYVDSQLPRLFQTLQQRGSVFGILCGDHGTAYGEDGYTGHRLAHPVVWNVPYAECFLPQQT
ncbi:MAG: STM4013/SEN3800 family hydrolase [Planctomycetaceae bacterium]|nr:STM4013/SEN3800 family hydrolase [Planctomycetaceae bacterium]